MVVENVGGLKATDVTAAMTNVPAGVAVTDGSLSWAAGVALGSQVTSDDTFSYSYTRGTSIDLTEITWEISYSDTLGTRHDIESVPE